MRLIRTVVDVLAYGALCFGGGILITSWWLLGPRSNE